jgi:hypothetical protein
MNLFTKSLSFKFTRLATIGFLAIGSLLVSSCSKDLTPTQEFSFLNITNASPGLGTYNVYVDQAKANPGALSFGGNIPYISPAPGSHNVKFTTASSTESLIAKDINLEANAAHSLFLVGKPGALDYLVIKDELGNISSDKAFIRFINLSPNAPALDLAVKDGDTIIPDKSYKASSKFTEVEAKTYVFQIKANATGTTVPSVDLSSMEFKAGRSYTILAMGLLDHTDIEQAFTGTVITNQ